MARFCTTHPSKSHFARLTTNICREAGSPEGTILTNRFGPSDDEEAKADKYEPSFHGSLYEQR